MPRTQGSRLFRLPVFFKRVCGIRHMTQLLYIFAIIITFIYSIIYLLGTLAFQEPIHFNPFELVNNSDISTYFIPKFRNENFHYPEIHSNITDQCIDRTKYMIDVLRLNGYPPAKSLGRNSYVLVFGSESPVGKSVIKELTKRKVNYIGFPNADTFGPSTNLQEIFPILNIAGAILCDSPSNPKDSYPYVKSVCEFVASYQKRMEVFLLPPYDDSFIQSLKWYGAKVIFGHNILDSSVFHYTNPLYRAIFDCEYNNLTNFNKDFEFHIVEPDVVAKYLVDQFFDIEPKNLHLVSKTRIPMEQALRVVTKKYPGCELNEDSDIMEMPKLPAATVVGKDNVNVEKVITKLFAHPQVPKLIENYISLVIVCNFSLPSDIESFSRFLATLSIAYKKYPLTGAEFILVDISSDKNAIKNKTIKENIRKHLQYLEGRVKLIHHPPSAAKTFYSAWNIGIRRAKGEFIGIMSMKDFLSEHFFGYMAAQKLDKRVIYRAPIYGSESLRPVPEVFDTFHLNNAQGCFPICHDVPLGLSPVIRKPGTHTADLMCSTLDFLMCSRDLWMKIGGLPEFPINGNLEAGLIIKSRFLKMFPTYATVSVRAPVLRLVDEESGPSLPDANLSEIIDEYWCKGKSSYVDQYENEKWGMPSENIDIEDYI